MRGLPYVGNKGQKAQQIIDLLPAGDRFIDCFGGGGSISLTAWDSGKWSNVTYNEKRKTVVEVLQMLLNNDPRIDLFKYTVPNREEFLNWRDNKPDSWERTLVLLCWSFSNNMHNYLWGKKNDKEKSLLSRAIFYGDTNTGYDALFGHGETIAENYSYFHKWRREQMGISSRSEQLERLQQLEQLQQLGRLQKLEQAVESSINFIVGDYRDLDVQPDDVVYCDPPYISTGVNYGGFDFETFHKWYISQPTDVYISEYTVLPDTEVYAELGKKHSMTATGKRRNELLLKVIK